MKILVTGASAGIGRATSLMLAERGHEVMAVARRTENLDDLIERAKELEVPGKILSARLDVSNVSQIEKFFGEHHAWLKDIDALVNNAGLALGRESLEATPFEDVMTMLNTNVTGLLCLTQKVIPLMKAKKSGHILNLGSVAGISAYKGGTIYCATKAAVHMITDALRLDVGGTGIRVTTVAPGRVETEFSEVRFKGDKEKAKTMYEGYRPLTPEDLAETIAWVLERPAHVNIQELVILSTDQPNAVTLDPLR